MASKGIALWGTLLVACSDSNVPSPPPLVQIELGNIELVAQIALDSALGLGRVIGPGAAVLRSDLTDGVLASLAASQRHAVLLGGDAPRAVITGSAPGPGGGTVSWSWDDHDGSLAASTGDTYALTFDDYVDTGVTLSGLMTFDHLRVVGDVEDPDTTSRMVGRVGLLDVEARWGNTTYVHRGAMNFDLEHRLTVLLLTVQLDGNVAMGDATLLPGNVTFRNHFTDDNLWQSGTGSVQHPALAGTLAYTTPTPFQGPASDTFPSGGLLHLPGAGGATMLITAVDNTQVLIQTDLDGDGGTDDQRTIPWGG